MGGGSLGFSKSKSKSSQSVWNQQAPYLQGLYERAYQSSLGGGTGGQGIGQGWGRKGTPGWIGGRPNVRGDGIPPGADPYAGGRSQAGGPGGLVGGLGGPLGGGNYQGQGGPLGGGYRGGDPLQQLGGSLTQQGQGFLGNLGMMGQAGNPFAQAQIGQLGQGLGRLFNQQIMPGIQSTFGQAGQLGGSRQALAQGQAAEGLGQAFTGGALDILGNSAQLALQANQAGLGGLGGVFDQGQNATFGSLPGLAGLLGGPTTLGKSKSKSFDVQGSGYVGFGGSGGG
jgi:hypothetical protein